MTGMNVDHWDGEETAKNDRTVPLFLRSFLLQEKPVAPVVQLVSEKRFDGCVVNSNFGDVAKYRIRFFFVFRSKRSRSSLIRQSSKRSTVGL